MRVQEDDEHDASQEPQQELPGDPGWQGVRH